MSPSTAPTRAPFAPIPWLTDRMILGGALALDALIGLAESLADLPDAGALSSIATEAVFVGFAIWLARSRTLAQATIRGSFWFGADVVLLVLLPTPALHGAVAYALVFSLFLAMGMQFTIRMALVRRAFWMREARALDSQDRLLLLAAAWTAGASILGLFPAMLMPLFAPLRDEFASGAVAHALVGPPMIAAALVALFATFRLRGRKRWLARVMRGDDTRFRVVPLAESAPPAAGTLPLVRIDLAPDAAIIPREEAEGSYRSAEARTPLALVRR